MTTNKKSRQVYTLDQSDDPFDDPRAAPGPSRRPAPYESREPRTPYVKSPRDRIGADSNVETQSESDTQTTELFSPTFASPGDTIQAPNIPFETIVMGSKLGSGTFGSVFKGSVRGVVVAIKVLKATSVNIEDLLQEVGIMSHLRFSNIVTMHGVCFHDDNLYIVSEYLPCGDLEHWLADKQKEIAYIQKLKILKDVAMAMNWLHSSDPPVIHRDLKPANVLLTTSRRPGDEETIIQENRIKEIEKDLMAKVTDMGLSKVLNTNQQLKADGAGSNLWMAPELLKYEYYTEKVDVYSFALLIWQVLTWTRNPFQDYLDRGDLDYFVEAVYYKKVRPSIPHTLKVHPKLLQLMDRGWSHNAQDRPDFTQIAMDLDDCLISTLFQDEEYAKFWKHYWGANILQQERRVQPVKEVIPWSTFAHALYEHLKQYGVTFPENPESDVYYLCLKAILIDPNHQKMDGGSVTLERFLLVEKWFGPFIQCHSMSHMPISMSTSPDIDILLPLSSVRTLSTPSSPSVRPASARRADDKTDSDKFSSPKSKSKELKKDTKASKSPEKKVKKESEAKGSAKKNEEELEIIRETPKTKRLKETKQSSASKPKKGLDDSEGEKLSEASVTATVERSEKGRLKASRQRTASLSKKDKGETVVKSRSNSAAPVPLNSPSSFARSKSTHSKTKSKAKVHKSSTSLVTKERPEEKTFLGAIKRMLEQTWFHGDISKEDADSSLATSKSLEGPKLFSSHGDFLVRLSFSEPVENHPFTITKVNKKGVIFHQRVFYQNSKYTVYTKADGVPEVSADSLINLVKLLTELKIVNQPCKRWNYARKYADIFEKKVSQDGGYLDLDDHAALLTKSAIK